MLCCITNGLFCAQNVCNRLFVIRFSWFHLAARFALFLLFFLQLLSTFFMFMVVYLGINTIHHYGSLEIFLFDWWNILDFLQCVRFRSLCKHNLSLSHIQLLKLDFTQISSDGMEKERSIWFFLIIIIITIILVVAALSPFFFLCSPHFPFSILFACLSKQAQMILDLFYLIHQFQLW